MSGYGVYEECRRNKELAAKTLLPLIEFEFGFIGDDKPTLVQSRRNVEQMKIVFEICREHGWTTSNVLLYKGGNPYFRINMKGLREIYSLAGPFADPRKDKWAQLLISRSGKRGGYKKPEQPTENKVLHVLKMNRDKKWWRIDELCLELKLLPRTVRAALYNLVKLGLVRKVRVGKSTFYMLAAGALPETLPGATAG